MVAFIEAHREEYGVEPICAQLPMAPSSYYEHKARQADPSRAPARVRRDRELESQIQRVWDENFQVYGVRKAWRQLNREDVAVARCTVARLMARLGPRGVVRGRQFKTTVPDAALTRPADRVQRNFVVERPDALWVSDLTYGGDLARLCLRGLRHRCVCPPHRGLACVQHPSQRPCSGCAGTGPLRARTPSRARPGSSQ